MCFKLFRIRSTNARYFKSQTHIVALVQRHLDADGDTIPANVIRHR